MGQYKFREDDGHNKVENVARNNPMPGFSGKRVEIAHKKHPSQPHLGNPDSNYLNKEKDLEYLFKKPIPAQLNKPSTFIIRAN